jgi:D-beta-D-heptose 7-phosphate kinase/D-beta-D-heptose 1-phosphate adenosyltransferase
LSSKIQSRPSLARLAQRFRRAGKRLVFTNGCFDLLHAGHVTYLEKAKRLGDILIVGLNADRSVRRIKGPDRPINSEKDRLKILAALETVDYVTLFSEETPLKLICEVRPHVLVKGADWKAKDIVGAQEVKSWRGKVVRVSLVRGRSTSALVRKLKQ